MDRGTLPLAVALLLASCSLSPTSLAETVHCDLQPVGPERGEVTYTTSQVSKGCVAQAPNAILEVHVLFLEFPTGPSQLELTLQASKQNGTWPREVLLVLSVNSSVFLHLQALGIPLHLAYAGSTHHMLGVRVTLACQDPVMGPGPSTKSDKSLSVRTTCQALCKDGQEFQPGHLPRAPGGQHHRAAILPQDPDP
uniref:Endoglin n=1 Tax=Homo sapiens TaxID=9606 RepID=A0AAQ5BHE8_HUMAN